MTDDSYHSFEIISATGESEDTVIKMDGVQLKFCTAFRIEQEAGEFPRLHLTLIPGHLKLTSWGQVTRKIERWYHRAYRRLNQWNYQRRQRRFWAGNR